MKQKWYFVTEIVLTYSAQWENFFLVFEKTFDIWDWRPRIFKKFEIIIRICSNSERLEQFSVTEHFFNLFLEVSKNIVMLWAWGSLISLKFLLLLLSITFQFYKVMQ